MPHPLPNPAIYAILIYVVGMWHSLVARIVRDDEAAGSNPVIPTIYKKSETSPIGLVFFVRRAPCCNPILMIECIPVNAIEGVVES